MKKSLIALAVLAASCFAVVPAAAQPVDDIGKAVSLSKSGKAMQMADAPVTQRGAFQPLDGHFHWYEGANIQAPAR